MRWFGFVLTRGKDTEVGRVLTMKVTRRRGRRRPARRWKNVAENHMRVVGLKKGMVSEGRLAEEKIY